MAGNDGVRTVSRLLSVCVCGAVVPATQCAASQRPVELKSRALTSRWGEDRCGARVVEGEGCHTHPQSTHHHRSHVPETNKSQSQCIPNGRCIREEVTSPCDPYTRRLVRVAGNNGAQVIEISILHIQYLLSLQLSFCIVTAAMNGRTTDCLQQHQQVTSGRHPPESVAPEG